MGLLLYMLGKAPTVGAGGEPMFYMPQFNGVDNSAKFIVSKVLTGNFEVEIEVAIPYAPDTGITKTLLGSVDGGAGSLDFFVTETETVRAELAGALVAETVAMPEIFDSALHLITLTRVAGVFRIFVDTVEKVVGSTNNSNVKLDTIGQSDKANSNLLGNVKKVRVNDQVAVEDVTYPMSNGSTDIQEAEGEPTPELITTNSEFNDGLDGWTYDPADWELIP